MDVHNQAVNSNYYVMHGDPNSSNLKVPTTSNECSNRTGQNNTDMYHARQLHSQKPISVQDPNMVSWAPHVEIDLVPKSGPSGLGLLRYQKTGEIFEDSFTGPSRRHFPNEKNQMTYNEIDMERANAGSVQCRLMKSEHHTWAEKSNSKYDYPRHLQACVDTVNKSEDSSTIGSENVFGLRACHLPEGSTDILGLKKKVEDGQKRMDELQSKLAEMEAKWLQGNKDIFVEEIRGKYLDTEQSDLSLSQGDNKSTSYLLAKLEESEERRRIAEEKVKVLEGLIQQMTKPNSKTECQPQDNINIKLILLALDNVQTKPINSDKLRLQAEQRLDAILTVIAKNLNSLPSDCDNRGSKIRSLWPSLTLSTAGFDGGVRWNCDKNKEEDDLLFRQLEAKMKVIDKQQSQRNSDHPKMDSDVNVSIKDASASEEFQSEGHHDETHDAVKNERVNKTNLSGVESDILDGYGNTITSASSVTNGDDNRNDENRSFNSVIVKYLAGKKMFENTGTQFADNSSPRSDLHQNTGNETSPVTARKRSVDEIYDKAIASDNENRKFVKMTEVEDKYPCKVLGCKSRFVDILSCRAHIIGHASYVRTSFPCPTCSQVFKTIKRFEGHVIVCQRKSSDGTWICDFCGEDFRLFRTLKQHVKNSHSDETYPCECGQNFKSKATFEDHKAVCSVTNLFPTTRSASRL